MIWLWFMIIWVGDIRIMKICSSGDMTVYLHNVSILVANMEIWWVYTVTVLASDDLVAYHSWFVIVFVFGLVDQVGQWPIPNISQAAPLRLCACCRRNPVLGMMPFRCSRQSLGSSHIRPERGKHMTRQERVICTAEKVLGLKKCVPSRNPLINLVKQGYHMKTCYRSRMFWWSHNVFSC